jgi:hypothetical protein
MVDIGCLVTGAARRRRAARRRGYAPARRSAGAGGGRERGEGGQESAGKQGYAPLAHCPPATPHTHVDLRGDRPAQSRVPRVEHGVGEGGGPHAEGGRRQGGAHLHQAARGADGQLAQGLHPARCVRVRLLPTARGGAHRAALPRADDQVAVLREGVVRLAAGRRAHARCKAAAAVGMGGHARPAARAACAHAPRAARRVCARPARRTPRALAGGTH